ncbi:Integrator complex subunit 4 [Polyrhizophydium stewartii]|uniref:Integrator complex subunit 4 n=1 Tax=Polyrhizophydium stewartii TaxID=2732419 RepID=A0ABR4MVK2_9FUNG
MSSKALRLMGTLRKTSQALLWQTLSKEIGGSKKLRGGQRELQTQIANRAKRMDAGDFDISENDVSLTHSSMCGAFIHGLEDEYALVRTSSIDAICELACVARRFADMSIPFLIDMFNDENGMIRLNAISSLAKISAIWRFSLKDDLVETVVLALFDSDQKIRKATHRLMGRTRLETPSGLRRLIDVLHKARQAFTADSDSILSAIAELGRSHAGLVERIVPQLLNLDPRFLPQALRADDSRHLEHLVLIFNACKQAPQLLGALPIYVKEQHQALVEQYSHVIPDITNAIPLLGPAPAVHQTVSDPASVQRLLSLHLGREGMASSGGKHTSQIAAKIDRDLRVLAKKRSPNSAYFEFLSCALFRQSRHTLSDQFSGVPLSALVHVTTSDASPKDARFPVWNVPTELRAQRAVITLDDPTAITVNGRVVLNLKCHIDVANVADLARVSIQVVPGNASSQLAGQLFCFNGPFQWTLETAICVAVDRANGQVDVVILCKIGDFVSSKTVKKVVFPP